MFHRRQPGIPSKNLKMEVLRPVLTSARNYRNISDRIFLLFEWELNKERKKVLRRSLFDILLWNFALSLRTHHVPTFGGAKTERVFLRWLGVRQGFLVPRELRWRWSSYFRCLEWNVLVEETDSVDFDWRCRHSLPRTSSILRMTCSVFLYEFHPEAFVAHGSRN